MPALNEAISQRRFKQVVLLINSGVNLNYKSSAGSTPLGQLCDVEPEDRALSLAKLFISKGGKIDKKDSRGRSALMCAILKGKKKLISLFLDEVFDFNLNAKDDDGNTALSHASAIGNVDAVREIVRGLRKFGLSVDIANNDGLTPLMIASKHGNFACAQVILNEGKASMYVRDRKTWKNATEWQKYTASRQPRRNRSAEGNFSFEKINRPKSSQLYTSLPRNTHAQKQEIQQLYHIYQDQLSSTYRIGFENSKIENSDGNGCLISSPLQTQPESFDRFEANLERSQARVLFTKSAAVVKFRKNSSMLNARKLSKSGDSSLSASCPAGGLSDTLKAVRETTREIQPKQESYKQGTDLPRRPIRSRSEILYTKTKKDEKEKENDFQYKKLPSIGKRRQSMNSVMLEKNVDKNLTPLEKQMAKITEER